MACRFAAGTIRKFPQADLASSYTCRWRASLCSVRVPWSMGTMRRGQPSPENSAQWNFLMLSIFHSRPIAAGRARSDAPCPRSRFSGAAGVRPGRPASAPGVDDGCSAGRGRPRRSLAGAHPQCHRRGRRERAAGLAQLLRDFDEDAAAPDGHQPATLQAIDRGDVTICEWTVGALAKALHVEAWQLLEAQALASRQGRARVSSEKYAGFAVTSQKAIFTPSFPFRLWPSPRRLTSEPTLP